MTLAESVARLCQLQFSDNMLLLVEDPAGSELFHLVCFERTWDIGRVVKINIPQCVLGLRIDGRPFYNNTILFASSILLLAPFKGLTCICKEHGSLNGRSGGVDATRFAQVWPHEMCQRICIGIHALLRQRRRAKLVHHSDAYPVGRPRQFL